MLDLAGALAAIGLLAGCGGRAAPVPPSGLAMPDFAPDEVEALRSLWIGSLPELPDDPSNRVADDPAAAALGEAIFADTRFSANGEVSCASCHQAELNFTDGLPRARGIAETRRKTMTVVGTAYSPWLFWDGRKDSQWAQALGPMEDAREHGGNRGMYAHVIAEHYRIRVRGRSSGRCRTSTIARDSQTRRVRSRTSKLARTGSRWPLPIAMR